MIILRKMNYFPRHIRFYKVRFSSHRRRFLKETTNQNLPVCILLGGSSFSLRMFRSIACTTAAGLLKNKKGHIQRHFLEPKYKKYFGQTHVSHLCPSEHMFLLLEKRNRNIFSLYYIYLKPKVKDTWATLNNIIPVSLFH